MSFKAINEFFIAFLENHGDEEILSNWKEESKGLNKIIKKKEKKANKKSSGLSKNKSAYIYFCLEERASITKKNPELSSKEITKILAKNWGELKENDDDDRMTELKEKALKDKERYTKEKSDSDNEKSDEPKKKKKMSVYILFCKEERATIKEEFPDYNSKEIISELGRRWTELKETKSDKISYYEEKLKEQNVDEEPKKKIVENDDEDVDEEEPVKKKYKKKIAKKDDDDVDVEPVKKKYKKKIVKKDDEDEDEDVDVEPVKKKYKKKIVKKDEDDE